MDALDLYHLYARIVGLFVACSDSSSKELAKKLSTMCNFLRRESKRLRLESNCVPTPPSSKAHIAPAI